MKTNWTLGYDGKGQPISNPAKMPQEDGALVSPDSEGAANWPAPSVSPQTGLFYVNASRSFSIFYIFDPGSNPQGWGGTDRGGWSEPMTEAIDYRTGKVQMGASLGRRRARGARLDRRQPRVHRRIVERSRGARRATRRRALARAPQRSGQQRSHHVRAGRPSVHRRGRRRQYVGVRACTNAEPLPKDATHGHSTTIDATSRRGPARSLSSSRHERGDAGRAHPTRPSRDCTRPVSGHVGFAQAVRGPRLVSRRQVRHLGTLDGAVRAGAGRLVRADGCTSQGDPAYDFHVKTYGHPSQFGFMEIDNLWKAERWDPVALMDLY